MKEHDALLVKSISLRSSLTSAIAKNAERVAELNAKRSSTQEDKKELTDLQAAIEADEKALEAEEAAARTCDVFYFFGNLHYIKAGCICFFKKHRDQMV